MEIIQLYKSDDGGEVCVISDGSIIYFTDKDDVAVESPKVGTIVRPNQVNEAYLEISKELLQEVARRSEIAVEPDPEDGVDDLEDDLKEDPPDWRPIALERFLDRCKELNRGINLRIITPIDIRIYLEEDAGPSWQSRDGLYDVDDLLQVNSTFIQNMNEMREKIDCLFDDYRVFAEEQSALGHIINIDDVDSFIFEEASDAESIAAE